MSVESGTTAPVVQESAPQGTVAPVAAAQTTTAPAAPAWSLDSWKDDQWDALPERIRKAAEGRYAPQLAERDKAIVTHQSEVQAAKRALQDAQAKWATGAPYSAEDLKKAQDALAAKDAEYAAYKAKYNDGVLSAKEKEYAETRKAEQDKSNAFFREHLDANLEIVFPWMVPGTKEAPNPAYDAVAMAEAERLTTFIDTTLAIPNVPDAVILTAAKLNEPQRATFARALAEDKPWRQALAEATARPAHTPSPAARVNQTSGSARTSRTQPGGARVDRSALRASAESVTGQGVRRSQS